MRVVFLPRGWLPYCLSKSSHGEERDFFLVLYVYSPFGLWPHAMTLPHYLLKIVSLDTVKVECRVSTYKFGGDKIQSMAGRHIIMNEKLHDYLHACSVMPNSLWPCGLECIRLLCPWESPGKSTGMLCPAILQGIFPSQGSHLGLLYLLHRRVSTTESPREALMTAWIGTSSNITTFNRKCRMLFSNILTL